MRVACERFAGDRDQVAPVRVVASVERGKREDRARDRVRDQARRLHAKERGSELPGQRPWRIFERDPEDRRKQREVVAALDARVAPDAEGERGEQEKRDGDGTRKTHAAGTADAAAP